MVANDPPFEARWYEVIKLTYKRTIVKLGVAAGCPSKAGTAWQACGLAAGFKIKELTPIATRSYQTQ